MTRTVSCVLCLSLVGCGGSDGDIASIDDAAPSETNDGAIATETSTDDGGADDTSPTDTGATDTGTPSDAGPDTKPTTSFVVGTNLSGAEFGSGTLPGTFGKEYTYPTHAEVDYFASKGFRVLRIPFRWERLQPTLGGALSTTELARLQDVVSYASSKGVIALIDPHNYARWYDKVIGDTTSGAPTAAQFAQFWGLVAKTFAGDVAHVWFGLMNEPHDMSTTLWLADANAAIAEIRKQGAKNLILVPGNFWTGAHSWVSTDPSANGNVMGGVVDPDDNWVYEVHQYLDADSSGTSATCVSATIGSERLKTFTTWLADRGKRAFLGELGASSDATCMAALEDMLKYVDAHRAQWTGWTWWSAGPWWGDYMFSIEPSGSTDKPQMAVLTKHE